MEMSHKTTSKLQFHIHIRHKDSPNRVPFFFECMGTDGKYSDVSKERRETAKEWKRKGQRVKEAESDRDRGARGKKERYCTQRIEKQNGTM